MREEVEKFSFFRSFWDGALDLGNEDRLALYDAMTLYAFTGEEPRFSGPMSTIWKFAKPNIDSSIKGQKTGGTGGRPKKENPPLKPPVNNSGKPPAKTTSKTDRDMDKDMDGDMDMDAEKNSSEKNSFSASVSDGAAAADAAPPSTPPPRCTVCGGLTKIDINGGFYRCRDPKCKATVKPEDLRGGR